VNVDPGELDQRIVIEREVFTSDGSGGQVQAWETAHGPMWAKVRPQSGMERARSDQVQEEAKYVVIIRNRPVLENQRLRWVSNGNLIMNIRYVERAPRALYIKLEVELGVAQ